MASFKEIKERISSVKSTRKITSAMKMVSGAKLHKAQAAITGMLPYSDALNSVMSNLLGGEGDFNFALTAHREVKMVAVVAFSSNSSLCGAFNSNVAKELNRLMASYSALTHDDVELYTVGKKITDAATKSGYNIVESFEDLADKPAYDVVAALADKLTKQFEAGEIDAVEMLYHHFKSAGSQVLTRGELLPLELPEAQESTASVEYILEPSKEEILATLIPKSIKLKLFTALLDSSASEHAARVIAMQTATDNADDLIGKLTVEFNKSRQQAITNELLDMAGGAQ